ncbi:hypothetical protein T10_10007 [Trichinella papuae]|uniref:Uncharacterized protein n=1 Tax=Trichinella papuae TaxID=268474 RepID=A0A0V1MEK3_9BILA|nr:hypothetical protein T10_10007 [Trichinella papuae]
MYLSLNAQDPYHDNESDLRFMPRFPSRLGFFLLDEEAVSSLSQKPYFHEVQRRSFPRFFLFWNDKILKSIAAEQHLNIQKETLQEKLTEVKNASVQICPAVPAQFSKYLGEFHMSSSVWSHINLSSGASNVAVHGLGPGIYHALVTLLGRRESPQCRHVIRCSFSTMCSMCSGNAQLLMDGRMIPNSSRMSNYLRHSSSQFGSSHRGLEKRNVVAQTIVTGYAARRLAN